MARQFKPVRFFVMMERRLSRELLNGTLLATDQHRFARIRLASEALVSVFDLCPSVAKDLSWLP
jgi:hypothetical protein